jgi:hypothetical protein
MLMCQMEQDGYKSDHNDCDYHRAGIADYWRHL